MSIKAICDICNRIIWDEEKASPYEDEITEMPNLKHVCETCYSQLNEAIKFHNLCKKVKNKDAGSN